MTISRRRRAAVAVNTIRFVNGNGGGFAENVEFGEGTTIEDFLDYNLDADTEFGDCIIKVNRDVVESDYVLQNGDRVSVTPKNVQGA